MVLVLGFVGYVNVVLVYIYGCRDSGQRDQDRYTRHVYLRGLSVGVPEAIWLISFNI